MTNNYDEILKDFQDAFATYGDDIFYLIAFTKEEWNNIRDILDPGWRQLGFALLGEHPVKGAEGYHIFAPIRRWRLGRWAERWEDACICYENLAARAGASLPLHVRKQIPYEPAHPASWWLTYMWLAKPPSKDDLFINENKPNDCRIIWNSPFFDSITAIEEGGLLVNEPKIKKESLRQPQSTAGLSSLQDLESVNFPNPSEPMSKKTAVEVLGGDLSVKSLTRMMENESVKFKKYSRQMFVFCRDDFPGLPTRK